MNSTATRLTGLPLSAELKHRFMSLDSPALRLELVAHTLAQMGFTVPD